MIAIPELRAIAIEAYKTMTRMPGGYGPSQKNAYTLEYPGMYADELTQCRTIPDSHQISRMEKFFDALNRLESEGERKAIVQWMKIQNTKGLTIGFEARKLGLQEHGYRKSIDAIFQKVIVHYNINPGSIYHSPVEHCDETGHNGSTSDEARASHWMADGAKPRADYEIPDRQNCMKAMLARSAERMGEAQGRQRAE